MLTNLIEFFHTTGFALITWKMLIMWIVASTLLYLAIAKGFEPLLFVPIAFGALMANLPAHDRGHYAFLAQGITLEIIPPLIFLGIGALTNFGPLIAMPRTLFLGAAAQLGLFIAFLGANFLGFTSKQASSIGIIGGASSPIAIFTGHKLAPELLGAIAVVAYSYMLLIPLIQSPILRLLTTEKERIIRMKSPRKVTKAEKLVFALVVMFICILLVPDAAGLITMLMLGNFFRECTATARLVQTSQNEIITVLTIFLGTTVGITLHADSFLAPETLKIIFIGVVAFGFSTVGGVLMAKLLNKLSPNNPVNPLVSFAGISVFPLAPRVSQFEGQHYDTNNYLLMHARGPNVAGIIGTAIAAGYFISTLSH